MNEYLEETLEVQDIEVYKMTTTCMVQVRPQMEVTMRMYSCHMIRSTAEESRRESSQQRGKQWS